MRRLLLLLGLLLALPAAAAPVPGSVPPSGQLDFRVYKSGSPIGHHRFRFERRGDILTVDVDIELRVRIAFITVYRYTHRSRETWIGGRLMALDSRTDDDGRELSVSARAVGDRLEVKGASGVLTVPLGTRPGSHWNAANLREKALIDTQWGSLIAIDATPRGQVAVAGGDGRETPARRVGLIGYELKDGVRQTAPWLDLDLWYDGADVLAGMEFHYRGYDFRYVRQ